MKRKLLFAMLCIVGALCGILRAQSFASPVSISVTNPDFDSNADGWDCSGLTHTNTWDTHSDGGATDGLCIEMYNKKGTAAYAKQTLSGLSAGHYRMTVWATGRDNTVRGSVYVYMGDQQVGLYSSAWKQYTVDYDLVSAGDVEIGINATSAHQAMWIAFDEVEVKYYGPSEQYYADLTTSLGTSPLDMTDRITYPDLSQKSGSKNSYHLYGYNSEYNTNETSGNFDWNGAIESWKNTFDVNQQLGGLPNGVYNVSVQVTSKDGKGELYGTTATGTRTLALSKTSEGATFSAIHSEFDAATDLRYNRTLKVKVTDGTLTFGLRQTNTSVDGNTWVVFDNFKLSYLGNDDYYANLGWTEQTTALTTNDYYTKVFAISDYYSTEILGVADGTSGKQLSGFGALSYNAAADPSSALTKAFYLEGGSASGTNVLRNLDADYRTYAFQTEVNAYWYFRTHDQAEGCEWTNAKFTLDDAYGYWTIGNPKDNSRYLGPWDETITAENLSGTVETAGNKTGAHIGRFRIYAMDRGTYAGKYISSLGSVSADNPVDLSFMTYNIQRSTEGWVKDFTGFTRNYQAQTNTDKTTTDNADSHFVEAWNNGVTFTGSLTRTFSNLPEGYYNLTLYAFKNASDEVTAFANNKSYVMTSTDGKYETIVLPNVLVTESGDLSFGLTLDAATWIGISKVEIEYLGTNELEAAKASLAELKTRAEAITSTDYNSTDQSALATAIENAETQISSGSSVSEVNAAYTALESAMTAATQGIAAYLAASPIITEMQSILEETNVYTKDAYDTFNANIVTYTNKTMTTSEANTLSTDMMGNRSYKQANLAIAPFLLSAWNCTNKTGFGDYYINTWSTEGDTDGSNLKEPFYEYYVADGNTLGDKVLTATLTSTDGEGVDASATYQVSALVRLKVSSSSDAMPTGVTFQVADGAAIDVCTDLNTTSTGGYLYRNVTAYGASDASGNLSIKFNVNSTNCSWLAFKNVKYTKVNIDLSDLKTVIDSGDAVQFGFADGEYAPYMNIDMLTALAAAKTIYNNAVGKTQEEIDDAKDDLTTAISNMVANSGEVNAIYWPAYSAETSDKDASSRIYALGWGKNGGSDATNTRIMIGTADSNKGFTFLENSQAVMTKFDTTYGEETGYTLPLKANQLYKLTFKYGGVENQPTINIRITDPVSNKVTMTSAIQPTEANAHTAETDKWDSYVGYFMTSVAGNYVITFDKTENNQQQTAYGNIDLRTATALEIENATLPHYVAGTYPSVTLSRTFKNDHWNTICLPFAVSASDIEGQFSEVKELNSITVNGENVSMKFADASAMTAGKPYLVKTEEDDVTSVTATNVDIVASPTVSNTVVTDDGDNYTVTYVGTFSGASLNGSDNANAWVVSNSLLYNVNSNVGVGAYRGYFTVDAVGGSVKSLSLGFDDLETAIEAIDNGEQKMDGDAIYNLAGQRVQKATKGLYIINGKKVMVK